MEVRGRYRTYEDVYGDEEKVHAHSDGLFEITEFVRSSTATADITACEWTCEREHGANSPICLAQVDGQCGSTRNSCIAGSIFDDDVSIVPIDTTTEYHWVCLGAFGGDDSECMAPKAATPPSLRGVVAVVSRLRSGPLTLYGWAYNTASSTATIPVEIYVGGAHGTGTLAETITADQPRADVNTAQSITGDHGFEWVVPTQYQSSE